MPPIDSATAQQRVPSPSVKRLNWGCGGAGQPGWLNSDRREGAGIDFCCDIRPNGLPVETDTLDYIVSIHALQEVPWNEIQSVLREFHRVLKPGGVLRLCLPDLTKGVAAYTRGDRDHFLIPDEESTCLGGKFILHMLWLGHSRLLFTPDFIEEILLKAGFRSVAHCPFQQTKSAHPGIVELDSREHESLFVEARK